MSDKKQEQAEKHLLSINLRVEREILGLVLGDALRNQTYQEKEASLLKTFNTLENYIILKKGVLDIFGKETFQDNIGEKYLPSFLCGEFLIYNQNKKRLQDIPTYILEELGGEYPRRKFTFYGDLYNDNDTKQEKRRQQQQTQEILAQENNLLSLWLRGTEAEKKIIIICVKKSGGVDDKLKLDDFFSELKSETDRDKNKILLAKVDYDADAAAQEQQIQDFIGSLGKNGENSSNKQREEVVTTEKFKEYLTFLNEEYAPEECLKSGFIIVYCPAIFLSEDPPANFWGLFSAEWLTSELAKQKLDSKYDDPKNRKSPSLFRIGVERIQTTITTIMTQVVSLYAEQRREQFRTQARKTAVGAIMSRNKSHHIGSHVIPRTTLGLIAKRLLVGEPKMSSLTGDRMEAFKRHKTKKNYEKIKLLKWKLDEYIQKKADFLAEITTEPLTSTKPAYFYREVIAPFISNGLLMDNLAQNEGVSYQLSDDNNYKKSDGKKFLLDNRLKIRVWSKGEEVEAKFLCTDSGNNKKCEYVYPQDGLPYSFHCSEHEARLQLRELNPSQGKSNSSHIEVALPGLLGEFAFYSFLENYIRNAAKHNRKILEHNTDYLEIHIKIIEPVDVEEKKQFYLIEISNNLADSIIDGNGETLVDRLNGYIQQDIIDETDGRLEKAAWGIAEMKICAALLRGSTNFDSLQRRDNLEVREIDGKITYCFRLMKARLLCAVVPKDRDESNPELEIEKLKEHGIWVFDSVSKLKNYLENSNSISSFRFAVIDNSKGLLPENEFEKLEEIFHELPFRIVILKNSESELPEEIVKFVEIGRAVAIEDELKLNETPDDIVYWAWKTWVSNRFLKTPSALYKDSDPITSENVFVDVYLDQEDYNSPTKQWLDFSEKFNAQEDSLNLQALPKSGSGDKQINSRGIHILYDRHGHIASKGILSNYMEKHSYNFIDKRASDFSVLFSPQFPNSEASDSPEKWSFPWELAEAGLLRILIVDERIAERAFSEVNDPDIKNARQVFGVKNEVGVPKFNLAWGTRVYICTHLNYLNEPLTLHDSLKDVKGQPPRPKIYFDASKDGKFKVSYQWKKNKPDYLKEEGLLPVDMVIIHQGILERIKDLHKENGEDNHQKTSKFLTDYLSRIQQHIPFVIVNSGRGIPPSLPDEIKFLPFSLLQDLLMGDRVAKYSLSRFSMQLPRIKAKERKYVE